MLKLSDILKPHSEEFVDEFYYEYWTYKKDNYAKSFLSKAFTTNLQAVYRAGDRNPLTKHGLDIGGVYYVIVNANGRVLHMTNSEWGDICYVDTQQK